MVAKPQHVPVLLDAVLKYLDPKPGESYLDLTAGYGGHASAVLERTLNSQALLVDRDGQAIAYLRKHLKDAEILHSDFLSACRKLVGREKRFDMILADLGVSSVQLTKDARGFSFLHRGPLDMRMNQNAPLTAEEIVNGWSEADLADILKRYGEEKKSRKIAAKIVVNRPILTTDQLAEVVAGAYRSRGRIHPATRTFQALRIVVNDELNQLAHSLPLMLEMLAPGGRLAVISFQSLEDRLVKQAFRDAAGQGYDAEISLLTRKPVTPRADEIVLNPRARSAKLRAVVKIKTQ